MRFDILGVAILGVGSFALAAADEPAPATPPERAAAPAAVVTDSASSATSAATAVPAPPPAASPATKAPAAPKAAAPDLSAYEQHLLAQGYKPVTRNGEKVYCRRDAALGSRISAGEHCGTVAELATATRDGREYLEKTQQGQLNPMGH